MKIEISIFNESGTKITSSHRSSNGFVYSGYSYCKPIVYFSLPFELSEENREKVKAKLNTYYWQKNFEPDWGISFGRPYTSFNESATKEFSIFLNSLNVPNTFFEPGPDNEEGCILNVEDKVLFSAHYKKHNFEWYIETLPILKKMGINYRSELNELLLIADQDISDFIDKNEFYLGRIYTSGNSWYKPAQICNSNGELKDCIKNSQNEDVVKIKALIDKGHTYLALKRDYSLNIDAHERIEERNFFNERGAR